MSRAHAVSSPRMSRAARAGSGAAVMGRPTTRKCAPARDAAAGVAMRDWSSAALPAGLTPGVAMIHRGPRLRRMAATSWGDATFPSRPASRARAHRCSTWPSTEDATPSSRESAARSRLVSTVTARTSGRRTASSFAADAAASAAAFIMARPPEACTLNMNTPSRVASRAAPATVLGMSWNFRSRKTSAPRFRTTSTAAGPAAVKSCEPILKWRTRPSSRSISCSAWPSVSTSRATIKRSRRSRGAMVLLQRLDGDLALQQRLDAADGRLGAVHGRVVGNVLGHGGAADEVGVLPRPPVLGRVEYEGDVAALHQIDDVWPVALRHLVNGLDDHALTLEQLGRARGCDEREAHLGEALGEGEQRALVAVLDGQEDLSGRGERSAGRDLRLDVGLAEVA